MRDGDEDITSRTVALTPVSGATVYANVYGAEKQPYITELLIDYEPTNDVPEAPYVVLEIYNPHPTPIVMTNWKLAFITPAAASLTLTEVGDMNATLKGSTHPGGLKYAIIAPGERIVLQNRIPAPQNLATAWASRMPPFMPLTNQSTSGTNLDAAIGHELVLLRPRMADGTLTSNGAPENSYNEVGNLYDLIPLDNIDTTGIKVSNAAPPAPQRYRYARANAITADVTSAAWHCVYPGAYTPGNTGGTNSVGPFRHAGLLAVPATGASADNGNFGLPKTKWNGSDSPTTATYDTRPLQINNRDSAGPNRPYSEQGTPPNGSIQVTTPANWPMNLPLGGFARNGDLLQVPFIGSYRIMAAPETQAVSNPPTLEMNSVTMDSVYAQYQATSYNVPVATSYDADMSVVAAAPFHNEQIGHFCPMTVGSTDLLDDPGDNAFSTNVKGWTYHWAKRLFDFLDVRTPQDAYLPNVDPAGPVPNSSGDPSITNPNTPNAYKYPSNTPVPVSGNPNITPVQGNSYQQLQGRLDSASTEGMININTANWKVLSAVPWVTPDDDPANYMADNAAIAQAIVAWRDFNNSAAYPNAPHTDFGPFRSIFDLQKLPQYKIYVNTVWTLAGSPGEVSNRYGDLSPFAPTFPASAPKGRGVPVKLT